MKILILNGVNLNLTGRREKGVYGSETLESINAEIAAYAKKRGASVLLRGLRTSFDFEYELQLSQTNHSLYNDIKTVFLITKPEYNFISSSCVREILVNKGDISNFVPQAVAEYLNGGTF